MNSQKDLQKYIPNLLTAYEKYILAATEFEKLNHNQDDFKDYLYTNQDYKNKKPVNELFTAAVYRPEILLKDTEKLIKEVIKTSGVKQSDIKLRDEFKKLVAGWNELLAEVKKIPEAERVELAKYLKKFGKGQENSSLAEEFRIYENLWN
jgi:hypothetical protein